MTKSEVVSVNSSSMLVITDKYIEKLRNFAQSTGSEFTDYEKRCVMNAIRTIDPMLMANNYSWNDFDVNNVMNVLQQTAFLKLNPSATPRECYYVVRKNYDRQNKKYLPPTIDFGIEGAGNDVILRNFGDGVVDIRSYIIYEGDEYDLGEMDGWDYKLPKHKRTFKSDRAIFAVYLIKKTTGEIEVAVATREDVKKSLLANARSNGADEKLIREMDKHTIDELLTIPKWLDHKIPKGHGSNTYSTPLFSPAWTSPISRESMILRKIRNHAVRRYPKNFNPEIQRLYEATFEDEKYAKQEVTADDTIALNQGVYETEANVEILDLDDVKIDEKVVPEPEEKPKRQYKRQKINTNKETKPEPEIVDEDEAEEVYESEDELTVSLDDEIEISEQDEDEEDMPDWMK